MNNIIRTIAITSLLVTGILSNNAQENLDYIKFISITDKVNYNFEGGSSWTWEIKLNDSLELWNTRPLSKAEFEVELNKNRRDSLNLLLEKYRYLGGDSLKHFMIERNLILQKDYQDYCDTVHPVFVKTIDKKIIINLLHALTDTTYNYNKFIVEINPADSIVEGLNLFRTSYYPLVGMTFVFNSGDSLNLYCNGQGKLAMPWNIEPSNFKSYNPAINRALYAILPKEMNVNRNRLITGIPMP